MFFKSEPVEYLSKALTYELISFWTTLVSEFANMEYFLSPTLLHLLY